MRVATTREAAWAFWTNATAQAEPSKAPRHVDSPPQAGLYAVRKWRNPSNPHKPGPWVPARIEIVSVTCPLTGELIADETWRAEIDGRPANPETVWAYGKVVTLREWQWLTAQSPLLPPIPSHCLAP